MRNRIDRIKVMYFDYLYELIEEREKPRVRLVRMMFNKPFYWSVPNDDNRIFESLNLRETFLKKYEIDVDCGLLEEDVSILEVIITLANRCQELMFGSEYEDCLSKWFWELVENIGLEKETDHMIWDEYQLSFISRTLNRIIDRSYKPNGCMGLFPTTYSRDDQREVELWYQMMTYLEEKYPF